MTIMERIKDALRKGVEPEQIAAIIGVSVTIVRKVQDRMNEAEPSRQSSEINGVKLYRYAARVKAKDGVLFGSEYVDWFTDDADAQATYRVIMEQQGYKVKSVTIGEPCIVEIE